MTTKRRTIWLLLLSLLIAGAGTAVVLALPQYQAWRAEAAYRSGSSDAKRTALRLFAGLNTARSRRVIRQGLADPTPAVRRAAALAVFAGRYKELADDLRAAIDQESEGSVRADMIVAWAQVTGPQAEPALSGLAKSGDSYTKLGSGRALLRLGDASASDVVFAFAGKPDRTIPRDAQKELLALAQPMGEMIGQPVPLPREKVGRWTAHDIEELHTWWQAHVTPQLLRDYLAWRYYDKPEYWRRVNTLLHEWRIRAPGFLRTNDREAEES